ncbi:hypothetical protein CMQ_6310 [Grosmannia clavigera kw1407]|uniref:Uncharacterized protein n=1 Tax=Grosmannia clavigera (strain kw1407 / UAMH 11150) TaxID=655863 RepID=F0XML4_GROCL|nr:uncharacterized protein CMQ_6310 [Grosmannia clavigera kw1407]EFX01368.1 hypothetical protein CMQ_6310 [Grosmannia clavigera kw1407]
MEWGKKRTERRAETVQRVGHGQAMGEEFVVVASYACLVSVKRSVKNGHPPVWTPPADWPVAEIFGTTGGPEWVT